MIVVIFVIFMISLIITAFFNHSLSHITQITVHTDRQRDRKSTNEKPDIFEKHHDNPHHDDYAS